MTTKRKRKTVRYVRAYEAELYASRLARFREDLGFVRGIKDAGRTLAPSYVEGIILRAIESMGRMRQVIR